MNTEVLLIIVGSFVTVIGSINAFFIKGLIKAIDEVRIDLVRIVTEHGNTTEDIREIKLEIAKIKTHIHTIELQKNNCK